MQVININSPLTLPCGLNIKNRLAKAAMTEGLASPEGFATSGHVNLYNLWAKSDVGLLITGNIMVDRFHLERAGNVVVDGPQGATEMYALRTFAQAATQNNTACFVQINHSGRQTPANINSAPCSASDVILEMPGAQFKQPHPMEEHEIESIVGKFSLAAKACQEAGFSGVQIHAAHGYLLSQFLSPKTNKRTDRWGGSLENRARLLMEVVGEVRDCVGADYPISVKLNSADFQKGGFTLEDCKQVVRWLSTLKIDLLEISGGTYKQPSMMGMEGILEPVVVDDVRPSTAAREAYFMDYAAAIRTVARMPLMVTGGFRSRLAMDNALAEENIDMIGIARPMVGDPLCTKGLLSGASPALPRYEDHLKLGNGWLSPKSSNTLIKALNGWGAVAWYYTQILKLGFNKPPSTKFGVFTAFISHMIRDSKMAGKVRKTLAHRR